MRIIGIDIGTTSICGVAVDKESGAVLASQTVDSNAFVKGADFEKIQSPEIIMQKALSLLEGLLTEDTLSIGVTGQMHGIVYVDENGNAVSPLYTWQDERGNEPFKNTTYAKYLGSCSGYGNVTDFYNLRNGLRPKNAVSFCTIHDYFVMQICGLKEPFVHSTNAASFGLYDIKENKFKNGLSLKITTEYSLAGYYRNIPVGVAIGDNQASVFSSVRSENELLINVGTGSQVSMVSGEIIEKDNIETRPYFEGKYLVVGSALCGGRAFSMLKDFYKKLLSNIADVTDAQVYEIMDRMLENMGETEIKVDPRFAGTRNNPNLTGAIENITVNNFNPEEITAAFLEGMAEELYGLYSKMGIKAEALVGSGNGLRKNKYFVKTVNEKFGFIIKTPKHLEEAAVGAALFGSICANVFDNSEKAHSLIEYI